MFNQINKLFDFNQSLLNIFSKKQEIISSNIANADTPNYKAVDINFRNEINKILKKRKTKIHKITLKKTSPDHLDSKIDNKLELKIEPINTKKINSNGNTVDMNRERIEFIKNSLKYEEQIIYLKNEIKNMMRVLKG
ncbi:flagellar basal body rod protein FlgB [Buchnera aphidicola (Melanaphis sacchari)]|uniref:Flagellar basal body rod protein FlgB n=1 Tax=Buchnera aphidicola (Melanaphis sacchari) TaxID=2173854 RepID=A0A2U8DFI5_9GAMM|nr:flagellar basal body rod protein FlgB [Buchnera aphidicola]AWH90457.1 flagellar basal body rod protein FlgB [Buchnera aphidicola (Melanaphis sacchari)]